MLTLSPQPAEGVLWKTRRSKRHRGSEYRSDAAVHAPLRYLTRIEESTYVRNAATASNDSFFCFSPGRAAAQFASATTRKAFAGFFAAAKNSADACFPATSRAHA